MNTLFGGRKSHRKWVVKAVVISSALSLGLSLVIHSCPAAGDEDQAIYGLIRGDKFRRGSFDAAGNFIPRGEGSFPVAGGFSQLTVAQTNMVSGKTYRAFEHRSGRLIKGVLTHGGTFVPDIGSRLMALADYRPDMKEPRKVPRIWNLPTSWPKVPYDPSPVVRPSPLEVPAPPSIGPPAGYDYHRFSQRQPPLWFAHIIGKKYELGHLDDAGDFAPDYELPLFPLPQILPQVGGSPRYYNLPEGGQEEEVYEYRSGRLLVGTLKLDGTFVPDPYSTVLSFAELDPEQPKRRIYNLPGYLTKQK